ncbi:MAG: DUF5010 domain-containing protein [Armatimonadota bacterium]
MSINRHNNTMKKNTKIIILTFLILLFASVCFAQKLAVHFFYWYDAPHNNVDKSKMPYHPPGLTEPFNGTYYSSLSVKWYEQQLEDMKLAGIDYALPVSWGEKGQSKWFVQSVLTRMVEAVRNTKSNIKISLYDDTQSQAAQWNLENGRGYNNSTTDDKLKLSCADPDAHRLFYDEKIKPFFKMIPRDMWATHNGMPVQNGGRPLILTFVSYYYKDLDKGHILWKGIKESFKKDFGVEPWLVPCWSWFHHTNDVLDENMNAVADGMCIYGAAMGGVHNFTTPNGYTVGNVGPGCETRQLGRPDYRPRWADLDGSETDNESKWFTENFKKIPSNVDLVMLESWNELWEGSAIARCINYPKVSGEGYLPETYYMEKTKELMDTLKNSKNIPSNLFNAGLDEYENGVAKGWMPFWVYGDVRFKEDAQAKHSGNFGQMMFVDDGKHSAGLYQRVKVGIGKNIEFSLQTRRSVGKDNKPVKTWVGIDTKGSTDPLSKNIVWSSAEESAGKWTEQKISAKSESEIITVFIKSESDTEGMQTRSVFDGAVLSIK